MKIAKQILPWGGGEGEGMIKRVSQILGNYD